MTPSPDLLAVLREARDALDRITSETAEMAVILASHPDRGAAAAEDIGRVARDLQRVFTGLDSALRAHEAEGWRPMSDVPPPGQYIAALAGGMVLPLYWSGTYWTGGMTRDCKQPVAWMPFPSFQIAQGEEP